MHLTVARTIGDDVCRRRRKGICAGPLSGAGTLVTLVSSKRSKAEKMIPLARNLARVTGKKLKLVKFTAREEMLVIPTDGGTTLERGVTMRFTIDEAKSDWSQKARAGQVPERHLQ